MNTPAIGHNRGVPLNPSALLAVLAEEQERLVARAVALADSARRFAEAYPTIPDADVQAKGTEVVRQVLLHVRFIEDRRKEAKEPYLQGGRSIDAWFNALSRDLGAAMAPAQAAMIAWAKARDAAERAAREAEAKKRAEDAELAERLAESGSGVVTHEDAATAAQEAHHAATQAAAKSADLTRVHGDLGGVSSLKRRWKPVITKAFLVPAIYLMPDIDAIKLAQKKADKHPDGKPILTIPGVEWQAEESMTYR